MLPTVKPEIARRLGKKYFADYMQWCGQIEPRKEHNGIVTQERRDIFSEDELFLYLIEKYNNFKEYIAKDLYVWCRGRAIEEVMYEHAIRYSENIFIKLGEIKAFSSGDFNHLYRFLALYVRYSYGCGLHPELLRGEGYGSRSGMDHSHYGRLAVTCLALMRPDWAKCFFPEKLGMVARTNPFLKRMDNLVIGLLHDKAEWKEKAYQDGRKFLEGKRLVSDRAAVSYLCNLYDGNVDGMSIDLETLMSIYHKVPWLSVPGGHSSAISLFGYYLMGKLYLNERDFANLRRPCGPGWWDEYIDICIQNPIPSELSEPTIIFPEPLGFLNAAVRWIEQGPPPDTVCLSLDVFAARSGQD